MYFIYSIFYKLNNTVCVYFKSIDKSKSRMYDMCIVLLAALMAFVLADLKFSAYILTNLVFNALLQNIWIFCGEEFGCQTTDF